KKQSVNARRDDSIDQRCISPNIKLAGLGQGRDQGRNNAAQGARQFRVYTCRHLVFRSIQLLLRRLYTESGEAPWLYPHSAARSLRSRASLSADSAENRPRRNAAG